MSYFQKDFIKFLKELEKNNNREWFIENKKRYETNVKKPFEVFVADAIDKAHAKDNRIMITPKDAIFRIYRDVRFSKDKTPYKTHVSAVISPGGRKDMHNPGMYIQLSGADVRLYSGVYKPDKQQLLNIRHAIASDQKGFAKLVAAKKFTTHFGEIEGEKNKIIPKDLKEAGAIQPLIYNKQFYYLKKWKGSAVLEKGFMKELFTAFEGAKALNEFFFDAMNGN